MSDTINTQIATSKVSQNHDMLAIATKAGQTDLNKIFYEDGILTVHDVRQSDLDAAVFSVDQYKLMKSRASDMIDAKAGAIRSRYTTNASGQDATYQLKSDEAKSYITAGRPKDTSEYPMLTAEASATNVTVSSLADTIISTREQWVGIAAKIEAVRMAGKASINALSAVDPATPTDSEIQAITTLKNKALNELAAI